MDYLDLEDPDGGSSRPTVTVASVALRWPLMSVFGLSTAALVVAGFTSPLGSSIAWGVLMVAGCGLLFYRRYDAIAATRSAGGVGTTGVQAIEKAAIAALVLACLANGVVIAWEVASWQVWADLRESIT